MESVGTTVHWHDTGGGRSQPNTAAYEIGSTLSPEDTALLQSLMNGRQHRARRVHGPVERNPARAR